MKRRNFLNLVGGGAAGLSLANCASAQRNDATANNAPPNIVVILADDMGYGDLTCLNPESKINTPNMDRIARQGVAFTDAHSPSAVCTPTRYGLLTGRYAWRSRLKSGVLWGWSRPLIEPERETVASMLKRSGYRTACVGKWHLGLGWKTKTGRQIPDTASEPGDDVDVFAPITGGPNDLGFDYFYGIPASLDMFPYCFIENDRPVAPPAATIDGEGYPAFYRGGPASPGFKVEDVMPTLTEKSVAWIDQCAKRKDGKPFFLYFPLTAPHTPWVPNEPFQGKSRAGVYGDFVNEVDWTVGQVLDALDRNGLSENTLVILTSDNGSHIDHIGKHGNGNSTGSPNWGHKANLNFKGQKADAWDGGHRVPFLARWPKTIPATIQSDETICLTDIMASCAAAAGAPMPGGAGPDSFNILPAMAGKTSPQPIREATIHHSMSGVFCVRQGPWKLILGRGSGGFSQPRKIEPKPGEPAGQLYNLDSDISETNNVHQDHPEVVAKLTALLATYQTQGHSRPMGQGEVFQ